MPGYSFWVLASIILVLLAWIWISLKHNRQLKKILAETREAQYGEIIRTIDHHRHDWMNDVQVLFGYIQLHKHEKLLNYIGRMNEQMRYDGLISKLGIPFLVAYLVGFRANSNSLLLDVRIEQEIKLVNLGERGIRVANLIVAFVEAYKLASGHGEGDSNRLSITVDKLEDQLLINFEYDGVSDSEKLGDGLKGIIRDIQKQQDIQVTLEDAEQVMDVEVRVRLMEMAG